METQPGLYGYQPCMCCVLKKLCGDSFADGGRLDILSMQLS